MSTSHTSAAAPNALALPSRQGVPAGQGDTAQRQVAWQREMERAQMASWFKPPLATGQGNAGAPPDRPSEAPARNGMIGTAQAVGAITGGNPAAVGSQPAMPPEPLAAGLRIGVADVFGGAAPVPRAAVRFFAEMRPAVAAQASPEVKALAQVQVRRGASLLQPAGEFVPGSTPDAEVEAAAESRTQPSSTPDDQAPLRLHEESTPEGQAVWIAMRADDDALAAMLPRIVADLQRGMLRDRGQRLYQVVCNGRLVWRDGVDAPVANGISIPGGDSRPTAVDSFHSKGA